MLQMNVNFFDLCLSVSVRMCIHLWMFYCAFAMVLNTKQTANLSCIMIVVGDDRRLDIDPG